MPNHVTHKIEFDETKAEEIFPSVCPKGDFDFRLLIPEPAHIYLGSISAEDEQDFTCNWSSWNRANWGTKWNCYDCKTGIENGKAFIKFDTAWSIPYPVLTAFANKFKVPFEHRYYDEGGNFWGIERWGYREDFEKDVFQRIAKRKSDKADEVSLCMELKGYAPNREEEVS
jgi:hypothetical protein